MACFSLVRFGVQLRFRELSLRRSRQIDMVCFRSLRSGVKLMFRALVFRRSNLVTRAKVEVFAGYLLRFNTFVLISMSRD